MSGVTDSHPVTTDGNEQENGSGEGERASNAGKHTVRLALNEPAIPSVFDERGWLVATALDAENRKRPRAPWIHGHSYPAKWKANLPDDQRPEGDAGTVLPWVGLTASDLAERGCSLPEDSPDATLSIGAILPRDPPPADERVVLIDWDDVRDPESGEIHPVCLEYLRRYSGYVEISQSGTGIHQLVFGALGERGGKFIATIDDEPAFDRLVTPEGERDDDWTLPDDFPQVELYDRGRHIMFTGDLLDEFVEEPEVRDGQALVDDITARFADRASALPARVSGSTVSGSSSSSADKGTGGEASAMSKAGGRVLHGARGDPDNWQGWFGDEAEPPEERPMCYEAALKARVDTETRFSASNHDINVWLGELGLNCGYEVEEVVEHIREYDPTLDEETTEYHLEHIEENQYSPPALITLSRAGVLPAPICYGECPIHGDGSASSDDGGDGDGDREWVIHEVEPDPSPTDETTATPSIPFGALCLDRDDLRRYMKRRGIDAEWPTTDEVRERIGASIADSLEVGGITVVDAPTAAGKTDKAVTTEWFNHEVVPEAVTGDQPLVVLCETREARNQAETMAREAEADLDVKKLLGYKEACCTANGEHEHDELYIKGVEAGEWFEDAIERRSNSLSSAHARAAHLASEGYVGTDKTLSASRRGDVGELPCSPGDHECRTVTQWPDDGFSTDDGPAYDLVLATHPFAFVPSLRTETNIIVDEQPDYVHDELAGDGDRERVRRIVTATLYAIDAPVETWEELIGLARDLKALWDDPNTHEALSNGSKPAGFERLMDTKDELQEAFDRHPDHEWYYEHPDGHTLGTALVKAVFYAAQETPDANGRRSTTVIHHPPRLDASAGGEGNDAWNRTWVTLVLDDENRVRTVREAPHFGSARSVVGLDAWPTPWLWQRNVHPAMNVERVLDPDERALWRRFERGLTVVQVDEATRPAGKDGKWFTPEHAEAVIKQLRAEFGPKFSKAGCPSAIEDRITTLLSGAGVPLDRLGSMHYGEEKSRNDFADEVVGLVYGCIDPGDDYVVNLLAECGLDAVPVTIEDADGNEHREHGRTFEGPDAEHAAELLASVRENHVAQMTGRFGRNLPDGEGAVVFVATDATPTGFVDYTVPGVTWLARPTQKQRAVVEHLREHGGIGTGVTAREVAEEVGCTKEHVRQVLRKLADQGKVVVSARTGVYGADEFRWLGGDLDRRQNRRGATGPAFAEVALTPEETTKSDVLDSYTWELAIAAETPVGHAVDALDEAIPAAFPSNSVPLTMFAGLDPPD